MIPLRVGREKRNVESGRLRRDLIELELELRSIARGTESIRARKEGEASEIAPLLPV